MQRILLLFFIFLFSIQITTAQRDYLSGYWRGKMAQGIENEVYSVRFELYLEVKGNKIKGKSYLYQRDGHIVEMRVEGYIHQDLSVSLYDTSLIPSEEDEIVPKYYKQYQFVHNRSIFESLNTLEGYWQQVVEKYGEKKRQYGKLVLQRVNVNGKA